MDKRPDLDEIERRIAHLRPQPSYAGDAARTAAIYAGLALAIHWAVGASGLPGWLGWLLGIAAAYGAARYDTNLGWKPYYAAFNDEYANMKATDDA